jgi:hypothetical protein
MPRLSTLRVFAASVVVAAAIALLLAVRPGLRGIARPDPRAGVREAPSAHGEPAGTSISSPEVSTPAPAREAEAVEVREKPAGPPRLRITGKVFRPDGEPAAWAQIEATLAASEPVRLGGSGPGVTAQTTWTRTEDDGTFHLDSLLPSLYELTATHESGRADARLRAGTSDVELVLREGLSIEGTVRFSDGEPATEIDVRARGAGRPGGAVSVTSDAGAFLLRQLLPGVYDLEVDGPAVQNAAAEAIRAGGPPVEIVVERAVPLKGRVVIPGGGATPEPIIVHVARAAGGDQERSSIGSTRRSSTDAEGRFEVLCPWPGPYRITTDPSPPYASAVVERVDPASGEVVIQLAEAAVLEVWVEDASTKVPLEDAETRVLVPPQDLRVGRGPGPRFALAETSAATVEARAPGYFSDRLNNVALDPRGEPVKLVFALHRAGWLSGAIRAEDGTPVEGARVSLAGQVDPGVRVGEEVQRAMHSGVYGGPTWTDASGAFRLSLERTRAGFDYRLAVEHPGAFLEDDVTVQVSDPTRDAGGLDAVLRRAGGIAGTVRGPDGPISGEPVLCFAAGAGYHSESSTGLDGHFEIGGLEPGAFTLKVEAPGHALAWIGPIEVAGGTIAEANAALEPEAAIDGQVTDPNGLPIAGATVATQWQKGSWRNSARARSDRDGGFHLGSLSPGVYTLQAEKSGFTTVVRRDVATGASAIDIVLTSFSRLEGRVTDLRSGRPVGKFTVRLLPARADLETHDPLPPRDFESEDGAYRIENVPSGSYRLIVLADGHLEHESALEVPEGEPATRDVALDEGSAIAGIVIGPKGQPVGQADVTLFLLGEARQRARLAATDEAGRFRVAGLMAGEYRLVVRHALFMDRSVEPVRVRPGNEAPPAPLEVRLEARATRD